MTIPDTNNDMTPDMEPDVEREEQPRQDALVRLRNRRKKLAERHTKDFTIPGYNGELVVRYHYVEWAEMRKIAEKVEKSRAPLAELYAQCDGLAKACDEIFYNSNDRLVPFSEVAEVDVPVRYDAHLAAAFEIEVQSVRQVIRELFNNDLAVTSHYNDVLEWLQNTSQEVDDEYMGESEVPTRSG